MKTYCVTIRREVTQTHDLEVKAEDEDDALEKAEAEMLNISDDDWEVHIVNSGPETDADQVEELTDDEEEEAD